MTYYDIDNLLLGLKHLKHAYAILDEINDYGLWGCRDHIAQMIKNVQSMINHQKKLATKARDATGLATQGE